MDETFYGLTKYFKTILFKHKGINSLYDWQDECLKRHERNCDKNLIYSVPTSGGKTLVAEILMLKELFVNKRNAIFVVPFVSIVQEKVTSLSALALDLGFWVEEYAGSRGIFPPTKHKKRNTIYICTIEKGTGLINSLIEENRVNEIGIVVIDEMHLIGESKRGALIESICIKLKMLQVKIVAMSATIGNLTDLAAFLEADLYKHDFRPCSLTEFVKIENELFSVSYGLNMKEIRFYKRLPEETLKEIQSIDPDGIGLLVKEVIPVNSCLVFCQSKRNCENVALLIVQTIKLSGDINKFVKYKENERLNLTKAIQMETNTICKILAKTIPFGVVYHHSGITFSERKLIEEAYSVGTISCICCTSTLAAGVNLPAQRVILRAPYVGAEFMTKSTYKQMIGRAGRAGLAEKGDSYLICKPNEAPKVRDMISSSMNFCSSQLRDEELKSFILSCYFLNFIRDEESLKDIMNMSFIRLCVDEEEMLNMMTEALQQLISLRVLSKTDKLSLSSFGKAIAKANISCEVGKYLLEDLLAAQKQLVLVGDLHLLYLITPHMMSNAIKPVHEVVSSVYSSLRPKELYVASSLGISESVIAKIMMGKPPSRTVPPRVLEKFYLCLILYQLWKGVDINAVAKTYKIDRGDIHNLLLQTTSFASSVIRFCDAIETFWPFVKLLSVFPEKLNYCCSADLFPLMELPGVKLGRAKQLYKGGFKTVRSIAESTPEHLSRSIFHLSLRQASQLINVSKLKVQTKYETLQEEAEQYILSGMANGCIPNV